MDGESFSTEERKAPYLCAFAAPHKDTVHEFAREDRESETGRQIRIGDGLAVTLLLD